MSAQKNYSSHNKSVTNTNASKSVASGTGTEAEIDNETRIVVLEDLIVEAVCLWLDQNPDVVNDLLSSAAIGDLLTSRDTQEKISDSNLRPLKKSKVSTSVSMDEDVPPKHKNNLFSLLSKK